MLCARACVAGGHGGRLEGSRGPSDSSADGAAVFATYCEICHGPEGRGDGPIADALPVRPRDYVEDAFRWGTSRAAIARTITAGRPPIMPSFADVLSADEIDSVAAWVVERIPEASRGDRDVAP